MQPSESRKLSTTEAAAYAGLAKSTLEKLRLTGYGPIYLKVARRVLYDVRDIEAWLTKHRCTSTSDIRDSANAR